MQGLTDDVIAISPGDSHTCALRRGGTVWCWGYNGSGELGNGIKGISSSVPTAVTGLPVATAISAGGGHTCALLVSGEVSCWGVRNGGSTVLVNGVRDGSATPEVTDIVRATAIAAGSQHTCALIEGGTVQCWGLSYLGQLGDGAQSLCVTAQSVLSAGPRGASKTMTEFRYAPLDYYFITSRETDKTLLDGLSGWARTGRSFTVLASSGDQAAGLSRFYFDQVARGGSRGSHFYTLIDSEKALLHAQNRSNASLPKKPFDEGIDSYAYSPVSGGIVALVCAAGLTPVYRLFRGNLRFPDDPNHRFTTDRALYDSFVAQGWDGEGVKFCVPPMP